MGEAQPFYQKGVNLSKSAVEEQHTSQNVDVVPALTFTDRIAMAYVAAVQEVLGADADADAFLEGSIIEESVSRPHNADKHGVQNAALVALIAEQGFVDDAVVVEYGCGRAGLGTAILAHNNKARCVLIERETRRHKFENKTREDFAGRVLRLRLDIADFDLAALLKPRLESMTLPDKITFERDGVDPAAAARLQDQWQAAADLRMQPWPPTQVLACAKHLCGAGTDIALRSLLASRNTVGVAVCIATCCHHLCSADSYVNCAFLQRLGLCGPSGEGFAELVAAAGSAAGGTGGSCGAERRRIGFMVKRILDLGRVMWLRDDLGLADAQIQRYIDKSVTPENIAIVAKGV